MKVMVLGAGVVGVASAWYLHQQGFEVEVIDRQPGPALEASFANAGGVCPGFAGPWASPGMLLKAFRWLFVPQAPLKWRPALSPAQWRWLWRFARNCRLDAYRANKGRMQRIAHYSQQCLHQLQNELGLDYARSSLGVLQLFGNEQELAMAHHASQVLTQFDVNHRLVDRQEVTRIEPALLQASVPLTGGLYLPDDEAGDCALFTRQLAEVLQQRGVRFHFNTPIERLRTNDDRRRVTGVETGAGTLAADAVVVALGCASVPLLHQVGIRLPIYPVKGYSVTLPIVDDTAAPRVCVMYEHHKVMIARLGNQLRAAGIAEISDFSTHPDAKKSAFVASVAQRLFPGAGDYQAAQRWCGLRPMTPDGPGYVGATPVAGLFLACGQGSNGWTQAAGVGRIVADVVAGRTPDIDLDGLTLAHR
ncbi:D-amino acid dehydrogenase [Dickeya sp. Secpp 1600]|uniref:D-amino acid dehydrogenase n=1 Tax=Dickeya sp. Secpp 1600 TaxID=2037915 RepID=UPI000D31938B|nr:D-amino acid dehydrogenase [Dickeya sp. Secpp 1600]